MVLGGRFISKSVLIKKVLFIFILVILMISNLILIYNYDFDIEFEPVAEYNCNELGIDAIRKMQENQYCGTYWFSLRDNKYNGFFTKEYLENIGINLDVDYSKYTYIVTFGYEMKSISYSIKNMKNRTFIVFPKQYVGKIVLNDTRTNTIYLYRIKQMDIDCDYHNDRNYNVFFVK